MAEYKTQDQNNYGWGLTLEMTGKAPAVAKRIFQTYNDALAYIQDNNDSAVAGLQLSVINDSDATKNGIYFVKSIGVNGELEKAGSGSGGDLSNYYTKSETQNYVTSRIVDNNINESHSDTWSSYAIADYVKTNGLQYLKDGSGNGSIVSKSSLVTNEATGNSAISLGRGQSVRLTGAVGIAGTSTYLYVTGSNGVYSAKTVTTTPVKNKVGNSTSLQYYFGYAYNAFIGARLFSTTQKLYGRIETATLGANPWEFNFTLNTYRAEEAFPTFPSNLKVIFESVQIAANGGTFPSIVLGSMNQAAGQFVNLFGAFNRTVTDYNTLIGNGNTACKQGNYIFGEHNFSNGNGTLSPNFIFGVANETLGTINSLYGYLNTVDGEFNSIFGAQNTVQGNHNTLIGEGLNTYGESNLTIIGRNNAAITGMTPKFVLGTGSSTTNRNNAIVIDSDDNMYFPPANKVWLGNQCVGDFYMPNYLGNVFDNFVNCGANYTTQYSITSQNYRRLFTFTNSDEDLRSQTGWCEGRITITNDGGTINGKYSFLVRLNGQIQGWLQCQDLGTSTSTRGLYQMVLRTPNAANNGSDWMVDIVCSGANTTTNARNITLEIISKSDNCTIVADDNDVTYANTSPVTLQNNGNNMFYMSSAGALQINANTANSALQLSNRLTKYLNVTSNVVGGQALTTGDLIFTSASDNKLYNIANTTQPIDCDGGVMEITAAQAANANATCNYMATICGNSCNLAGMGTTYPSTWTTGRPLYLKCTYPDANGDIYSLNEIVLDKSAGGFTYYLLGRQTSTSQRIALNTESSQFYSLNANGKLTHINGMELA